MDSNQLFVVSTVSRETIAEKLTVEPTDPRLTDEFCQRVANGLHKIECRFGSESQDEAEVELFESFAAELN